MRRSVVVGAVAALFLMIMIAAAVQGRPTIDLAPSEPREATPLPDIGESAMPTMTALPDNPGAEVIGAVIGFVFLALAAVAVIIVLILLARALARAWRDRPLPAQAGADTDFDAQDQSSDEQPEASALLIRRGIHGALRVIEEHAVPTDAIIAAWVGLEESATDAGVVRGASETPSEFAVRIISQRAGISDAANELLGLYERVRFGGHIADESDREAARAALQRIDEGWR